MSGAGRPPVVVGHARLAMLVHREGAHLATLSEYAQAAGLRPDEVLELFAPNLEAGALATEAVDGQLFIHTAPLGRPAPALIPQASPNLWEVLRARFAASQAAEVWRLLRDLETSGWRTEAHPSRLVAGLGAAAETPVAGVLVGAPGDNERVVPVLHGHDVGALGAPGGPLARYEAAGAGAVAATCDAGRLDDYVTAVRVWMLARPVRPVLSVYLLEAPRYDPVLLNPNDVAIAPRAVSRSL